MTMLCKCIQKAVDINLIHERCQNSALPCTLRNIEFPYTIAKVRRPENQVLSGGKYRTVGASFLLRSCCHKKTHRDHYDSGKQQES